MFGNTTALEGLLTRVVPWGVPSPDPTGETFEPRLNSFLQFVMNMLRPFPDILSHTGVFKVVLQKSIPSQIRQLTLYSSNNKGQFDRFVRELTSAKPLQKTFE